MVDKECKNKTCKKIMGCNCPEGSFCPYHVKHKFSEEFETYFSAELAKRDLGPKLDKVVVNLLMLDSIIDRVKALEEHVNV